MKNSLFILKVGFRTGWKALIILIIGMIITLAAAINNRRAEETNEKKEFALVCKEIDSKISIRLHSYALLLRSGSALFSVKDSVSRTDWHRFIQELNTDKNLPGIQGVGYAKILSGDQLQKHIRQTQEEGFPEYAIKPAGKRDVYSSVIYLEPFSGRNLRAFGYDMLTEPVRRGAMEQSCDLDLAVLSGKVTLVQETNEDVQFGALMYVPVYRENHPSATVEQRRAAILGWVYIPFRMNNLMNGILGRWDADKLNRIQLQVYDDSLSAKSLLYNSQASDLQNHRKSSGQIISIPVNFNGKRWILHFTQSTNSYYYSGKSGIIVGSGLTITLLIMALYLSMLITLSKARGTAEQSTREFGESEERFKILLNSTAEAIYGIDLDGNCTFTNKACIQLLGYTDSDQLLGKNMHDLIHYAHPDGSLMDVNDCLIFKAFIEGDGSHVDNEVLWRCDGTPFPAEYWSYPIHINGKIEGAVVTFFDITERQQTLEKINQARSEAEPAPRATRAVLSRMSHELRTPMNSILGFGQLLVIEEKLSATQKKCIGHMLNSGKHLLNLINEVLDISRIESGHIELLPEPVLINSVIREMLESVQPQADARKIKFELINRSDIQLCVIADRQRLKQVLLNLLSNAVKYNREGGSVIIEYELMAETEAGTVPVRISITDTGIGIAPYNIPRLFTPFERIGAETTATEGTGLGLAVVKKLISAMNGAIGVASEPGTGSTFWIEFPMSMDHHKINRTVNNLIIKDLNEINKQGTILYIEDNFSNIELVEQIIASQRLNITLISNIHGMETVQLAIKYQPDLILLDLNLPDIHGYDVLMLLQAEIKTREIPVVVISADAMPLQLAKLLKAGARNYLTKPLDVPAFLQEVDKWVV